MAREKRWCFTDLNQIRVTGREAAEGYECRGGKICAHLTRPRVQPFLDASTLRQYLMHVLSVIKWRRVYRLRPRSPSHANYRI